ncbi:hypothetical protein FD755_001657 [Muntiacus reevesi]|uniref:Mos1 transposase HTH domain-containing protein n=1 Tax=Muntiacus reevesi TaxID=9886 RepID=A0A5J5N215_MUNRE|nr:hypothetical protein FD755_001657 [Muntiacus reevesi]
MGCKAAKTTHNIKNTFDPGIANKHTVQWWFKKFCKGDKSLDDEEHSGWSLEVDNNHLRVITETDPFTNTQDVAEELNINHSTVIWHEPNWKVSSSLILCSNNKPFLYWIVMCRKWILYDNWQ